MKILMHYNGTYSENAGVSRVVRGLGKAMLKKGAEVEFLYGYGAPKGMHSYLNALKGPLHFLHHTPFTALLFANFMRGKNFDIVHSHTPEAAFDAVVARFLLRKKYKVVVHLHGLDKAVREEWKKEIKAGRARYGIGTDLYLRASIFKAWFSMKMADSFAAVSHAVQKEAGQFYGVKPEVVLNAVDCGEFKKFEKGKARKELGFSEKDFVVLFVGNNAWRKGLGYLVEAFSGLPENFRLAIVGIEDQDFSNSLGGLKDRRISCKGQVGTTEISKYYSAADVLCVPSVNEPFGLVYAEAMCFGLPCIGCNGTGAEEIISDSANGFLVRKRNPEDIRLALRKINSKKAHLSGKPLPFGASWKNAAKTMMEIYSGEKR
ncbi:MAG: glycosyltransferase family 4 protein [Candidatus Diapherotrites archaeon]|nr:glycosyltransferase family 4 protein [Candidatus Diapherotrites archaeon]